jgi:hypothetical protein
MTKSHELGRRASKLELESTEQNLLFHLAEVQRRFESANDDLVRQAAPKAKASTTKAGA